MPSKILSIYPGHNANITLLDTDGSILFAAEEARFTRVKDQAGIPNMALEHLKQSFSEDLSRAARVTIRDSKLQRIKRDISFSLHSVAKGIAPPNWRNLIKSYWTALQKGRAIEAGTKSQNSWFLKPGTKLINVGHHTAHAASAYYSSGFKNGPVMTLDGQGDDRFAATFYWGHHWKLEPLNQLYYNEAPVGYNFQLVTTMLGFHGGRHPGKLTGLAAYQEINESCIHKLDQFLQANWRRKTPDDMLNYACHLLFTTEGKKKLKETRGKSFGSYSMKEMACAIQYITERDTLHLIRKNLGPGPYPSLALAGGVFGNVKLNQKIKEMGVEEIFIQPAMGDQGLSLGAAHYHAAHENLSLPKPMEHAFHGPEFPMKHLEDAIDRAGLKAEKPDDIEEKVAHLLADKYVVARFDGAVEYGPRALGNRSILFHTEDKSVNDWLNKRLNRTEFMPFAPATLIEDGESCYRNLRGAEKAARFMTITFDCTDRMKKNSPAVVHVDGTARPQLVDRETNPRFYRILSHFKKLTGNPSLINTSFNMHEEPIVCSADDAIRAFVLGHLDFLALGPFLLKNK